LFSGAIVEQNFVNRAGRLERFTNLLKDTARLNQEANWPAVGRRMIGLAVDADTALVVEGNQLHALGDGHGHIFVKENGDRTIHWQRLAPDDGKVEIVAASKRPSSKIAGVDPSVQQTAATRNPFGIPEPIAGAPPGSIVLHGGGPNGDLIKIFPGLANVSKPKLVHCPSATRSFHPAKDESASHLQARLEDFFDSWVDLRDEKRLGALTFLTTADSADARRETFVATLRSADAVWFSGGDQSILTELYGDAKNTTPFQQELIEVVRRGGVVGGTSAGTAVMARVMTVSGEPQERGWTRPQISYGFGLLSNVVIEQHFNGRFRRGRIERFMRLLLDQDGALQGFLGSDGLSVTKSIGLAVEEKTALLLQENRLRVFGQQNAHVFLKSANGQTISWHELHPGDAAFIIQGPNGPKLELDDWGLR
jgi:cyanophycinase